MTLRRYAVVRISFLLLQGGNVWEKAGVNVSVVYGSMPPEAYRAATGTTKNLGKENGAQDRVPFFACGISSVMHPHNPFAPTMHFNYRYVSLARCQSEQILIFHTTYVRHSTL